MKKILIVLFAIMLNEGFSNNPMLYTVNTLPAITTAPTITVVVRSNGGLFGYKTVTSQTTGQGDITTACGNPGFNRCHIGAFVVNDGGLSAEEVQKIDDLVLKTIKEDKTEGQFVYESNYLVVYDYNVHVGRLKYQILTKEEADKKGYAFN